MGKSLRNLEAEAARRLDRFDAARVRALADGDWLTFADAPGLRIERNGRTRLWLYRYKSPIDNRSRRIRIGRWPRMGWEAAWTAWDALRRARDEEGIDPQLDRRARRVEARARHTAERSAAKRRAVTVETICRLFLKEHIDRECTEGTRVDTRRMFESRVIPVLGARPAHEIDRSDAVDFLAKIKLDAPATARLLRSRLGGAWEHAVNRKKLAANAVNSWRDALRGKLKAKPRTRYLDDAELAAFLARLPTLPSANVRDALALTLYTAARSGEVVAMDWAAVDLARGTWTIKDTKADAPRTVRLPRQAVAILKARGRGFEITQGALAGSLRDAKHLGLKHFTPHDLRRSARTGMARLGVRDEVCEAALGHVQGGIRGTYNLHAYEAEVGAALQLWADHLGALAHPSVVPLGKTARRRA